ncbi:hypothetical protein ACFU9X_42865 [Streptomyces atratus]|uniref:hypothetical protein n=1 Tax=Streptomyces atratus TaxID=1893 RepID=UPI0036C2A21B
MRAVRAYVEADFDEVHVNQIGPDQQGFFGIYSTSVLPQLRDGCRLIHDLTLLRHDVDNGALNVPVKAELQEPWLKNAGLLTSRTEIATTPRTGYPPPAPT